MSFKGAASALLVLVIVGAILGNMATNQLSALQPGESPVPTPPSTQSEGSTGGDGQAHSTSEGAAADAEHQRLVEREADLQRRAKELDEREKDLQRREVDLAAKLAVFEARLAEIERDREQLREAWALLHQQQNTLGWAYAALFVLALMTALAMVATGLHRRTRRRASTVSKGGELRRAYLRPNGQHPARPTPSPGQAPQWPAGSRDTHEAHIRERIGSIEGRPATAKVMPTTPSGPGGNGRGKK
jgi:hypothetical protein